MTIKDQPDKMPINSLSEAVDEFPETESIPGENIMISESQAVDAMLQEVLSEMEAEEFESPSNGMEANYENTGIRYHAG